MSKNTKQNNTRSGMVLFLFCPPLLPQPVLWAKAYPEPQAWSPWSTKLWHREFGQNLESPCPAHVTKSKTISVCCSEEIHWLVSFLSFGKKVRLRILYLHFQREEEPGRLQAQGRDTEAFALENWCILTLTVCLSSPSYRSVIVLETVDISKHSEVTMHRGPFCAQGPGKGQWNSSDRSPFDFFP